MPVNITQPNGQVLSVDVLGGTQSLSLGPVRDASAALALGILSEGQSMRFGIGANFINAATATASAGDGGGGTDPGDGGGGDPGDGGGGGATVGTARFAQYDLAADYTIATTSLVKPAYTALGTDANELFDTANVRYVVDAEDNGKFGIFTHSFLMSGESGRDFIIAVQKALAATPTTFVRECEMRHTTSMGLPVGQPFLLATGDVYEFVIICLTSGTSPTISAADLRNGISVEIIAEVSA